MQSRAHSNSPSEPVGVESPSLAWRGWSWLAFALFVLTLGFHAWAVTLGWRNINLPGYEFRQTQTAVSALFIQRENDFSLAYPTPVLGAPWSIPFEFPLYQWCVAVVGSTTGLPLAAAARVVGIACFYLTLPALFLLLRRAGLMRGAVCLVLAFVLTSPLYIFYTRAFLIEGMALLFGAWYLAALVSAAPRRAWNWSLLAMLAGTGAGLVKVTTFLSWLMPAFVCSSLWLWHARPAAHRGDRAPLRRTLLWLVGVHLVPFVASWAWVRYSDAIKALNPSGAGLTSDKLAAFNFGYGTRFDPKTWLGWWTQVSENLASPQVLALGALVTIFFAGRQRWLALAGVCAFFSALLVFPLLYAIHGYYFYATGVLLLGAIGVALTGMMESPRWRLVAWVLALLGCGLQARQYLVTFAPTQRTPGNGGGLADALRTLTGPEESVIIAGGDWSSIIPYYSERRALMVRSELPGRPDYLHVAFPLMQKENVAALVLLEHELNNVKLLNIARQYFDLDPQPVFRWQHGSQQAVAYLHRQSIPQALSVFGQRGFHEVTLLRDPSEVRDPLRDQEVQFDRLLPPQKQLFRLISPAPERFYSTFGPQVLSGDRPGTERFAANPETKLWFTLAPGRRRIRTDILLPDNAWQGVPHADGSDGVELVAAAAYADGRREVLQKRYFDPRSNPAERGVQPIDWTVELPAGAQLELSVNGGPAGNGARDWSSLGALTID